jgi:anionic cell wall polymer biosynthesis LytR-Cps2A-Psr (LCP) family protein
VVTAEKLTGLPIQHVIAVNFKGFIDVIDNLGGLKVCLKAPINDPKSHLNLKGGTQTLDGTQALALARARKTLGDGSDISRTHRQQYIIHQLAAQVKASNLLTDPAKAYDVASALTKSLTTDTQLGTVQALASLGLELRDVQSSHIHLITLPWKPDPNNPNVTVVIDPKAAAGPLLAMSKDIEPQNAVTSSKVAGGGTLSTASPSPSSVVIPDAVAGSIFCPVSN